MISEISSDAKRATIAALLAERARRRAAVAVSSAQLRLWLIDRQTDAAPIYNVSRAFRVNGPLDVDALGLSLTELVRRHAVLRTTFALDGAELLQTIHDAESVVIERSDVSTFGSVEAQREAQRIAVREAQHPFNLECDPMLRAALVRHSSHCHTLVLTFHHIAVDEWSLGIIFRELETTYRAYAGGTAPALAALPMTYADYAHWEREHNAPERTANSLAYWRDVLAGAPAGIGLPQLAPPAGHPSYAGAVQSFALDAESTAALAEIGRRADATPFMTYLAAFAAVLHALGNTDDIVIGSPISGRRLAATHDVVGFFANIIALRSRQRRPSTFIDCIRAVRTTALDAFAHSDVPFDRVVNAVSRSRNDANPVFSTAFTMQGRTGSALTLPGLIVTPLEPAHTTAKFDLLAAVSERAAGVDVALHYRTAVYAPATIARVLEALRRLLEGLAADPDAPLESLITGTVPDTGSKPFGTHTNVDRTATVSLPIETPTTIGSAGDAMIASLETQLHRIWTDMLGTDAIDRNDDFFALGGHSLLAVRLIAQIERTLAIRLPVAAFFAAPTLAGLARALIGETREPTRTPLVVLRRGTLPVPVVVFHGDFTGGGFYFANIARELGDRTIVALGPHGTNGEPVPETIEAMAAERLAALHAAGMAPPFDLVGHCNGAQVALEVARQLVASGASPARVFAIGSEVYDPAHERAANVVRLLTAPLRLGSATRANLTVRYLRSRRRLQTEGAGALPGIVRDAFVVLAEKIGGRPSMASDGDGVQAQASALLDVYARRLIAYRPGRYAGPLTVFRPINGRRGDAEPAGWARVSPAVRVELIPGDHQTAITTHASHLAQRLRVHLDS